MPVLRPLDCFANREVHVLRRCTQDSIGTVFQCGLVVRVVLPICIVMTSADYHPLYPTTITIHPMTILPPLPEAPLDSPWSANVHLAHQVLRQCDSDPLRVRFHNETLVGTAIPIFQALEASARDEGIPTPWIHLCAENLGELVRNLRQAEASAEGQ